MTAGCKLPVGYSGKLPAHHIENADPYIGRRSQVESKCGFIPEWVRVVLMEGNVSLFKV